MELTHIPPGLILVIGALLLPLLPLAGRRIALVALPLLSGLHLLAIPEGTELTFHLFEYVLEPVRVDRLSLVWGYVFHLAAFLAGIYALHEEDQTSAHMGGLVYAGSAIGAVFAGDLLTLFIYWELTAVASVFLIWAKHSYLRELKMEDEYQAQLRRSRRAGMRYLIIQVGSGVLLLAGILLRLSQGGSLAFEKMELAGTASLLIFVAFAIKGAFPFFHNWLQDAYPEATPTGTVFLSAFTTKMAIYAFARGFPGTQELIWIGAVMTAFPIFFAVIENDLRRVLAYSLNNQLGFMIVGIGIGTELSLNGTAAHAFAHILYKAVLFMSMGAVLHRTGTAKGSDLGGLYKSMPWTTLFCIVGAASISAFPLTSGFVSKSLILTAAADGHFTIVWLILLFASAGVFHHSGIKIPFFAFFHHSSKKRDVKEAPLNMLVAMGITATLCLVVGMFPGLLYGILPYEVAYVPYTASHVISQLQLLFFSGLAFTVMNRFKVRGKAIYPPELRSTVLDTDWIYRRFMPTILGGVGRGINTAWSTFLGGLRTLLDAALAGVIALAGPRGLFGTSWPAGRITLGAALLFGGLLVLYLF